MLILRGFEAKTWESQQEKFLEGPPLGLPYWWQTLLCIWKLPRLIWQAHFPVYTQFYHLGLFKRVIVCNFWVYHFLTNRKLDFGWFRDTLSISIPKLAKTGCCTNPNILVYRYILLVLKISIIILALRHWPLLATAAASASLQLTVAKAQRTSRGERKGRESAASIQASQSLLSVQLNAWYAIFLDMYGTHFKL